LGYALSGGASDAITDVNTFTYAVNTILAGMTANGAKGAIANIPNVTDIPYCSFTNTRLPYNGLVLGADTANLLNTIYTGIGQAIGYEYGFNFTAGPNAFVIVDNTLPLPAPYNVRQMTADELFLLTLPQDSLYMGMGSIKIIDGVPQPWGISNQFVLASNELLNISEAITDYNGIIEGLATQFDLALVDMNAKFNTVATTGMEVDGIMFTTDFITGNTFSLDGVHMTAQGYSVAANFFIEAINDKYGAGLTTVSPRLYPGIYYYQ
jgi:hypothetical protein